MLLELTALGTLVRSSKHLSYPGGPKSPLHTFYELTNWGRFDLRMSLVV